MKRTVEVWRWLPVDYGDAAKAKATATATVAIAAMEMTAAGT